MCLSANIAVSVVAGLKVTTITAALSLTKLANQMVAFGFSYPGWNGPCLESTTIVSNNGKNSSPYTTLSLCRAPMFHIPYRSRKTTLRKEICMRVASTMS